MSDRREAFERMQRARVVRYLELRTKLGAEDAREVLLEGYPERQKANMGPLIEGVALIDGFGKAQPLFAAMGVRQELVDVSTPDTDAVLEINVTCMCAEAGATEPLLCELDFEATRRAFPEMTVCSLHRMVDGANACVFRYERPK